MTPHPPLSPKKGRGFNFSPANRFSSWLPLSLLLLLTAVRGAAYLAAVPPWLNPDEPTHFEYAARLARGGPLGSPRAADPLQKEIIASLDRHRFWEFQGIPRPDPLPPSFSAAPLLQEVPTQIGRKPFLYYLLASFPLRLLGGEPLVLRLHCLRVLSLLCALGTVAAIYAAARRLLPADPVFPFAAAAAAAFVPQFMLAATSAGPDALANLLCAGVLLEALDCAGRGLSLPRLAAAVALLLLAVLATYRSLIVLPPLMAGGVLGALRHREGKRWPAVAAAVALLAVLYSALVWAAPGAVSVIMARLSSLGRTWSAWRAGSSPAAAVAYPHFHRELFRSFWLKFGWARFSLPPWYYAVTAAATLVAAAGLAVSPFRRRTVPADGRADGAAVGLLLFAGACALLAYYLSWGLEARTSTVQGRHLFPALAAWSLLFVLGWRGLAPEGRRRAVYGFLLALLALLDAVALFGFIFPTFA